MDPNFVNLVNAVANSLQGASVGQNQQNGRTFQGNQRQAPLLQNPPMFQANPRPAPLLQNPPMFQANPRPDIQYHNNMGMRPPQPSFAGRGSYHNRGMSRTPKGKTQRGSQSLGNLSSNNNQKKKGVGVEFAEKKTPHGASVNNPTHLLYEPPPSYDESVASHPPKKINAKSHPKNPQKGSLDPQKLVRVLSSFRSFWNSVPIIAKLADSTDEDVLKIVKNNGHIFSSMKDSFSNDTLIELCPNIAICSQYMIKNGCSKKKCKLLHICSKFITSNCDLDRECSYGHNWRSGHNSTVLANFHLESIDDDGLMHLLKKQIKLPVKNTTKSTFPNICGNYNGKGCPSKNCSDLHICMDQIVSLGACSKASCSLNHNVFDPKVQELMEKAEISTNESPRDLMRLIGQKCQASKSSDSNQSKEKKTQKSENTTDNKQKQTSQKVAGSKPKKLDTNDLIGDVEDCLICSPGLNSKCKKKDCKKLHSLKPYHWQFNSGRKWYNFLDFQSEVLEGKYKNPTCSGCSIPPLNSDRVPDRMKQLLALLGSGKCINADFNSMIITGESFTGLRQLRRLSTISSVLSPDERSTVFKWYFHEDDKNWKMYDTNQGLSSEEIEKAFQKNIKNHVLNFSYRDYQYSISFSDMIQTNLNTGKQRPLKRRPKGMLKQEKVMPSFSVVPSHWSKIDEREPYKLVDLDSKSAEFQEVYRSIKAFLPVIHILSISRIQNPHLWKQFKNKEVSMANRNYPLNVTKLFHGLEKGSFDDICCNNLDFRLHESGIEMDYGDGAYFYNSAAFASQSTLCPPDVSGIKRLLVSEVILGTITAGSKGLSRPPCVDGSDDLYDTTVDNPYAPNIFVKYNKQEYYPSHVVSFKIV